MAKQIQAPARSPNVILRLYTYFQEVRVELEKVTWPSRDDLKAHTLGVLFFLGLLAVMIGSMDIVFQRLVLTLFKII